MLARVCESVEIWKESGSFLYFRTLREATDNSTDVLVRMQLADSLPVDVNLFCCAVFPKAFVLQGTDGRVVATDTLQAFGVKERSGPGLSSMIGSGQSRWRF